MLVHGGSSGIGVDCHPDVCKRCGHTVFATAGSAEKCRLCETLGAARAINYKTEDFVAVVKEATNGKGVDVILDMVGGDYVQRNMTAAAIWGRIVNIAYQSGARATVDFEPDAAKAADAWRRPPCGRARWLRKARSATPWPSEVWPLVAAGRIRPVVDRRFPLAEAQKAHAIHGKIGGHIGKILLIP